MACYRCADCPNNSHHWMNNPDFGNDPGESEYCPDHTHICKHCPVVGDECEACDGTGEWVDEDDVGHPCADCDEEGVIPAACRARQGRDYGWRAARDA